MSPGAVGVGMDLGFLGMGIMGQAMAANLIKGGHRVTVWNRTPAKCEPLVSQGAKQAFSPSQVVSQCDITIAMLSDPAACLSAMFDEGGVSSAMTAGKSYVDMSTVDDATSGRIAQAITEKGGRFLEAPVSGSKKPAIDGALVILAAGDESLYSDVLPAFEVMGKRSFYLGPTGNGARMKLVVNMVMGSMMVSLCEGLSLAAKSGLKQQDLLEVMSLGAIASPMFSLKGPAILSSSFAPSFPLKHQQKDMRLALALGDDVQQQLPVAAASNELYKRARELGYSDEDFCAVFKALSDSSSQADKHH